MIYGSDRIYHLALRPFRLTQESEYDEKYWLLSTVWYVDVLFKSAEWAYRSAIT